MAYKVLVVDDSSFFRRRVADILNADPNLEVIDIAVDGKEAVEKAFRLKPDVITMDIEMPVLNGIEAVKQIMSKCPTSILMFSSLTQEGATATLQALEAGALDFLPKKFNEIAANSQDAGSLLRQRVTQIARRRGMANRVAAATNNNLSTGSKPSAFTSPQGALSGAGKPSGNTATPERKTFHIPSRGTKKYDILAIGSSTGGPVALQKILTQIPSNFPLPIILVQHMPAAFTKTFAERLNTLCQISVKEASDGDVLQSGCAYLAPGGRQMLLDGTINASKIRIKDDNSPQIAYKPSVDISFASVAKIYSGNVLGLILTGMGADGKEGSRMLKNKGATIWSQNEETCVVYGMPQAVESEGISDLSLALDGIASALLKEIKNG